MKKLIAVLIFISLGSTAFSQKLKIENYIFWKEYYHGESEITKSQFIDTLKSFEESSLEFNKSESYSNVSDAAAIVTLVAAIDMRIIIDDLPNNAPSKLQNMATTGVIAYGIYTYCAILSSISFKNAIEIYNRKH